MGQEYELAEDEVTISLERFRDEYCHPDGSVKYAFCISHSGYEKAHQFQVVD